MLACGRSAAGLRDRFAGDRAVWRLTRFRRGALPLALVLTLTACGVSKDVYRDQVVQSQELEARAADLEERLASERELREEAEAREATCGDERADLRDRLARTTARVDELRARLNGCTERETSCRADLDVCRKANSAAEAVLVSVRADLESEKAARAAETAQLRGDLEACRGSVSDLEAQVAVLREEKTRTEREKREKLDEISRTYEGFLEGMKEEIDRGRVTISRLKGRLTVNLLDEILFDSGSATIKAEGRDVLQRLGAALQDLEEKAVVVEGHTDDVPISGELARRFPTNWELSTARATSVVRYLQEAAGVPPHRLSAVGFGPYRPVAANDTPEGRARNRRIEIKLVPMEAPVFGSTPPGAEAVPATPVPEPEPAKEETR